MSVLVRFTVPRFTPEMIHRLATDDVPGNWATALGYNFRDCTDDGEDVGTRFSFSGYFDCRQVAHSCDCDVQDIMAEECICMEDGCTHSDLEVTIPEDWKDDCVGVWDEGNWYRLHAANILSLEQYPEGQLQDENGHESGMPGDVVELLFGLLALALTGDAVKEMESDILGLAYKGLDKYRPLILRMAGLHFGPVAETFCALHFDGTPAREAWEMAVLLAG